MTFIQRILIFSPSRLCVCARACVCVCVRVRALAYALKKDVLNGVGAYRRWCMTHAVKAGV